MCFNIYACISPSTNITSDHNILKSFVREILSSSCSSIVNYEIEWIKSSRGLDEKLTCYTEPSQSVSQMVWWTFLVAFTLLSPCRTANMFCNLLRGFSSKLKAQIRAGACFIFDCMEFRISGDRDRAKISRYPRAHHTGACIYIKQFYG